MTARNIRRQADATEMLAPSPADVCADDQPGAGSDTPCQTKIRTYRAGMGSDVAAGEAARRVCLVVLPPGIGRQGGKSGEKQSCRFVRRFRDRTVGRPARAGLPRDVR